jgi:hypothetical protein
MKKINIVSVLGLIVFMSACGLMGNSTKLQVKWQGKQATLNGKASYVSLSEVSPIGASFTIANYEPKKVEGTTAAFEQVKSDEQLRVTIALRSGKATDYKIQPGEYAMKAPNATPMTDQVMIYYWQGGEMYGERNVILSDAEGIVTITSVTDNSISGTIDVGNEEKSVKGDFTAKLLKK